MFEIYEKGRLLLETAKADIKLLRDLLKSLDMKNSALQTIHKGMVQRGYVES